MGKLYSIGEVADLVGVTSETIRNWEAMGHIATSTRMGLQKKRVWSEWKVERILEFAKGNGYAVSERTKLSQEETGG